MNRVIWFVLDSVGVGELPDASDFGDFGVNTIRSAAGAISDFDLPNMRKLGFGNIQGMEGVKPVDCPIGAYGKCAELSKGKDTPVGHWEMAGIETKKPYPVYPNGFPKDVMDAFVERTGCGGYLANKVASGPSVINEYAKEHIKTGYPIIYTSTDSVFQIAAHEDVIPVERLYEICCGAREILTGEHEMARVIARPFIGNEGHYKRTVNRRDFTTMCNPNHLLTHLAKAGYPVAAVGKISDVFDGQGVTTAKHTQNNMDGIEVTLSYMREQKNGLIFTNLVEFDSEWGHRRDAVGYAHGLMAFDQKLKDIISQMTTDDLLIITADHGCDPNYTGKDHTREYVPVLMYHKGMKPVDLGVGKTFANMGQTVCELFGVEPLSVGESYFSLL